MDLATAIRVVFRRWLVALVGVLLTAGAMYGAYEAMPRSYTTTSQVMLLLPPDAANPSVPTSPFLYLPGGLGALARIVILTTTDDRFRADMEARGFEPQYEVALDTQGPIVRFTVEGANPDNVAATRDELVRRFASEIDRVQQEEKVPERQLVHLRYLDGTTGPLPMTGDRVRAVAAVGVLGIALTLLAMFLIDRWLNSRAIRRRLRRESELADSVTAETTTETGRSTEAEQFTAETEPPAAQADTEPLTAEAHTESSTTETGSSRRRHRGNRKRTTRTAAKPVAAEPDPLGAEPEPPGSGPGSARPEAGPDDFGEQNADLDEGLTTSVAEGTVGARSPAILVKDGVESEPASRTRK